MMFKDLYPATYRTAMAHRREKERQLQIKRSLLEAIGRAPPVGRAAAAAMSTQAPQAVTSTLDPPSLRLSIVVPNPAEASIRIDRVGGSLTVTIALDGCAPGSQVGRSMG